MATSASDWRTYVQYTAATDVGLRRTNNQDAFAVVLASSEDVWRNRGHVFLVADGMGAHAAGELASQIAAETIPHTHFKLLDNSPSIAIQKAIEETNAKIHARGMANPDFKGMGTTASVLLLLPEGAMVAHVGDSRVYRLRGDRFEQLSFDHSLVWEMRAAGKMSEQQVPGFIPRNIITRSLGPSETVQVDVEGPLPLVVGDTFLLCSDGLSGQLSDEELGAILQTLPLEEAVQVMIDLANLRGGPDNITIVVARVAAQAPDDRARRSRSTASSAAAANPLPWAATGALILVAAILGLAGQPAPAVGVAIAALVLGTFLLIKRSGGAAEDLPKGARLGNAPYVSTICKVNNEFVDKLAKVVEQLRTAATEQGWSIDWSRYDGFCSRAVTAAENRQYPQAVREYCHAVRFMMQQLRSRGRPHDEDSSIELGER